MLEGLLAEDQCVHREQRVEPTSRLIDRLGDELGRELHRLVAAGDVGIADLGCGHGTSVEPRVDDRFDALGLLSARATTDEHLIDGRTMGVDITDVAPSEARELFARTHAGEVIVGTAPNRQWRPPESVA